jgi:hypothetical protein
MIENPPPVGLKAPANPFPVPRTQPEEASQLLQSLSSQKTDSSARKLEFGDVPEAIAGWADEFSENPFRRSPPECSFYSRDATHSKELSKCQRSASC